MATETILDNKAREVLVAALKIPPGQQPVIDPATVTLILQIIKEVVMLFRAKKTAPQAAAAMRAPNILQRRALRRLIRNRALPENLSVNDVQEAALHVGKTMSDSDVVDMYVVVPPTL